MGPAKGKIHLRFIQGRQPQLVSEQLSDCVKTENHDGGKVDIFLASRAWRYVSICIHTHTWFSKHRNLQHGLVHTHTHSLSPALKNTGETAEAYTLCAPAWEDQEEVSLGFSRAHTQAGNEL